MFNSSLNVMGTFSNWAPNQSYNKPVKEMAEVETLTQLLSGTAKVPTSVFWQYWSTVALQHTGALVAGTLNSI